MPCSDVVGIEATECPVCVQSSGYIIVNGRYETCPFCDHGVVRGSYAQHVSSVAISNELREHA